MSKNRGQNFVAGLEKAVEQKYGKEAARNPKSDWTEEKEQRYLAQLLELKEKEQHIKDKEEYVEVEDFLVNKKLTRSEKKSLCPECNSFLLKLQDDIYVLKHSCCQKCYITNIEGRE